MVNSEVENLLKTKNIYYRIQGDDFVIRCLNPDHDDSNPSLRIDKVRGIGQCFACSFKLNIFQYFGLITNTANIRVAEIKQKIAKLRQSDTGLDMLDGYTPVTSEFRGISVKTLNKFDIFYTDKVEGMEDRLIIPIKDISGHITGFVGRHMLSNANPRYMIQPRKATLGLLPPALETATTNLLLVEGLFDFLNLYDKGIHNVVATLGTATLLGSGLPTKMLPYKTQGVRKIFICFDGDNAGREASEKIKPLLEKLQFIVEILGVEDGRDPGNYTQQEVDDLKSYINND